MATTSGNLMAGKAIGGRAGDGGNGNARVATLVATAALGLSLLTGIVIGQVREEGQSAAPPAANRVFGTERQLFLERNLSLPSGAPSTDVATYPQLRYLEQNTQLPITDLPAPISDQFVHHGDPR